MAATPRPAPKVINGDRLIEDGRVLLQIGWEDEQDGLVYCDECVPDVGEYMPLVEYEDSLTADNYGPDEGGEMCGRTWVDQRDDIECWCDEQLDRLEEWGKQWQEALRKAEEVLR